MVCHGEPFSWVENRNCFEYVSWLSSMSWVVWFLGWVLCVVVVYVFFPQ